MDPITIVCSVLGLLPSVKEVSDRVTEFLHATGRVHEALVELKEELDSLFGDIDNVNNICRDPELNTAATVTPEKSQSNIFARLQTNLDSCTRTVDQLSDLISKIDQGGSKGFLNRAMAQYRLDERANDLTLFRKQIQTHRGSMHLSVSALTL